MNMQVERVVEQRMLTLLGQRCLCYVKNQVRKYQISVWQRQVEPTVQCAMLMWGLEKVMALYVSVFVKNG